MGTPKKYRPQTRQPHPLLLRTGKAVIFHLPRYLDRKNCHGSTEIKFLHSRMRHSNESRPSGPVFLNEM
jgi:hypothetical protein